MPFKCSSWGNLLHVLFVLSQSSACGVKRCPWFEWARTRGRPSQRRVSRLVCCRARRTPSGRCSRTPSSASWTTTWSGSACRPESRRPLEAELSATRLRSTWAARCTRVSCGESQVSGEGGSLTRCILGEVVDFYWQEWSKQYNHPFSLGVGHTNFGIEEIDQSWIVLIWYKLTKRILGDKELLNQDKYIVRRNTKQFYHLGCI